jgi:AdoMet-dependent rRNA methyltransferase SPB1
VQYDSENEQWDDEERAATLAIGTMMLRRSKAKALVDASYNRFAWNDANDLPEWFVDDEEKHYRPQVRRSAKQGAEVDGRVWMEEGRVAA